MISPQFTITARENSRTRKNMEFYGIALFAFKNKTFSTYETQSLYIGL